MENDITLEALDIITDADNTADNSVKKIKNGVKQYSERLNKDREKIRNEMSAPVWENDNVHVVLLCYEKRGDFCHRHLVADWLNKNGFNCEEWI